MYTAVKGMSDILPGEVEKWQYVERRARDFLESRGFQEIRTPVVEQTELFTRSIGEASDIVHKEMYTFEDRGKRSLTLRPEMTAGVARAAIENHLLRGGGIHRLYYFGPMFRAERPQAGRRRQFHQLGVEILGAAAEQDIEMILLAHGLLEYLGLKNFKIKVNNIGSQVERQQYEKSLREYFLKREHELCEDCRFRLVKNVLRVFDCKVKECQPVIQGAPPIVLRVSENHFQRVIDGVEQQNVHVEADRRIVRGLDYYNFCVFEVTTAGLGAQDAVLAGGRYDGLLKMLSGPEVGACGFAMGMERLLVALSTEEGSLERLTYDRKIYFALFMGLSDARKAPDDYESGLALRLIQCGYQVIMGKRLSNVRDHLKSANQAGARFIVFLGDNERRAGKPAVKDLSTGVQIEVQDQSLVDYFTKNFPPFAK